MTRPCIEHYHALQSSLLDELVYVDDADFMTEDAEEEIQLTSIIGDTLAEDNLIENKTKREHTIIMRDNRLTEKWRVVKKLDSLLGNSECY